MLKLVEKTQESEALGLLAELAQWDKAQDPDDDPYFYDWKAYSRIMEKVSMLLKHS